MIDLLAIPTIITPFVDEIILIAHLFDLLHKAVPSQEPLPLYVILVLSLERVIFEPENSGIKVNFSKEGLILKVPGQGSVYAVATGLALRS